MAKYSYSEGTYSGKGNARIAYKGWEADKPKGILVIIHGIGEHSGRYNRIVDALGGKRISVFALDLRGHGKSQGDKGHIDSFLDYIFDLKIFMNMIREAHSDLPVIMLGHSLGGAIACRYSLTYQNDLKGIVLSSPALSIHTGTSVITRAAAPVLSVFTPKMEIQTGIDPKLLTHDEQEMALYSADPLIHNIITPRLYSEILKNGNYCSERAADIRIPLLVTHGGSDKIVPSKESESLFEHSLSDDKQLLIIPDLFHEIMNETPRERAKVLSVISGWIASHITGKAITIKVKIPKSAILSKKAAPKPVIKNTKTPVSKKAAKSKTVRNKTAPKPKSSRSGKAKPVRKTAKTKKKGSR